MSLTAKELVPLIIHKARDAKFHRDCQRDRNALRRIESNRNKATKELMQGKRSWTESLTNAEYFRNLGFDVTEIAEGWWWWIDIPVKV
jgi:hypothetical protein